MLRHCTISREKTTTRLVLRPTHGFALRQDLHQTRRLEEPPEEAQGQKEKI